MSELINLEEDVELGEQVEVRTRPQAGAVVAVRVSKDLLARVNEYGRLRGLTVSDVLREGAERLVTGTVNLTHYVSGAQVEGPGITPGSPSRGGSSRTITAEELVGR